MSRSGISSPDEFLVRRGRKETPCSFQRTCPIVYIMFRYEDIGVKVAIKLRSGRKRWLWGPRFLDGRDTGISGMLFQIALTSEHVAGFG